VTSRVLASLWMVALSSMLLACSSSQTAANRQPEPLPGEHITRAAIVAEHGNVWPFTVDEGTLSCVTDEGEPDDIFSVVFTTEGGTQYEVNGNATNTGRYTNPQPIWARDQFGRWKDSTVIIALGLKLCPGYKPGF
jgi:hypothetical protein